MKKIMTHQWLMVLMMLTWGMQVTMAVPNNDSPRYTYLIVADSTALNEYVPVYGWWMDDPQKSQTIYPAELLTDMVGETILSLKYYTNIVHAVWNAPLMVYMGITEMDDLSGGWSNDDLTLVYSGTLQVSESVMEVMLTTPFTYTGGNLVIMFDSPQDGYNYNSCSFYGKDTYIAASRNAYGSNYSGSGTLRNFIPKTAFAFGEPATCAKPTNLTSSEISAFTANVAWLETGNATAWTIQYGEFGFVLGEGIEVNVTNNPATLTDLAPNTQYQFYVKSVCAEDDESEWSNASIFTTLCASYSLPFSEIFLLPTVPSCWERKSGLVSAAFNGNNPAPTSSGWSRVTTNYGIQGPHVKLNIYGSTCNYWLITPLIELDSNSVLSFDMAMTAFASPEPASVIDADDRFMVIISTDGGQTWSQENAFEWDYEDLLDIPSTAIPMIIDLSAYSGEIKIAFYGESTIFGGDNDIHIGNIQVAEASSCLYPYSLTASRVFASSALIEWIGHEETTWNLAYATQPITNFDTATIIAVTENPYSLTNLLPETNYYVYVQANCGNGNVSQWSNYVMFHTPSAECLAPNLLSAIGMDNLVALSWTATTNTMSYTIYRDSEVLETEWTDIFYNDTSVVNETEYCYSVVSNCSEGASNHSNTLCATPQPLYYMPTSGTITISTCDGIIYDDGGPNANYSNNCNGTMIIMPPNNTTVVHVAGHFFIESYYDNLYVYDGVGTSGTLLNTYSMTDGGMVDETSTLGPLTLVFTSDASMTKSGFALNVACFSPSMCNTPCNLTATNNPESSNIVLTWTGSENAESYNVYLNYTDITPLIGEMIQDSMLTLPYSFLNTIPVNDYCVQIQTVCAEGNSMLSDIFCFSNPAPCNPISTLPFFEGFEGLYPIHCWNFVYGNANDSINPMGHTNIKSLEGSQSFRFSSYSQTNVYDQYLISPEINVNEQMEFSFYYSTHGYDECFKVGYSITTNDVSAFVWSDLIVSNSENWSLYVLPIPAGAKYVSIHYCSQYKYWLYIDNFSINFASFCSKPTNVTLTDVPDSSSVLITWEEEENVAIGFNVFLNGTDITSLVSELIDGTSLYLPYSIMELYPSSNFCVEIQAKCSATEVSVKSDPVCILNPIPCSSITQFPYFESFEGDISSSCWSMIEGAGPQSPNAMSYSTTVFYEGSHSFMFSSYYYASNYNQYLITPELQSDVALNVSFWYVRVNGEFETFSVGYSTTGNELDDFTFGAFETATTSWQQYEMTVPAGTKYVCVHYYADFGYFLFIDAFQITEGNSPTECLPPSDIVATAVESNITLTWDAPAGSISPTGYKIVSNDGGNPIFVDDNTFTYTFFDLAAGQHCYIVSTQCGDEEVDGIEVCATIEASIPCPAPTNLTASANGANVNLTWSAPTERDVLLFDDFENVVTGSLPEGWISIDADGDGNNWYGLNNSGTPPIQGHSGTGLMTSASYDAGALTPDNYLISPMVEGALSVSYWISVQDVAYFNEYYALCASSTGTAASDFEIIFAEELMYGKNSKEIGEQGTWFERNIEVPMGTKYIAFRHFNCSDAFRLNLDDVTIEGTSNYSYKVYRESLEIATVSTTSYSDNNLAAGEYCYSVKTVCNNGLSDPSNTACAEIFDNSCSAPVLTAETVESGGQPAVMLSWTNVANAVLYTIYHEGSVLISTTNLFFQIVDDLQQGNTYCYNVTATCALGESDPSNTACAEIPYPICMPPVLSAEPGEYQGEPAILLSWTTIQEAISYSIFVEGNELGSTTDQSVFITGVEIGQEYCFTVITICANGSSEPSNTACSTIPLPTTYTIVATAGEHGSISPSGNVIVDEGANQAFIISVDPGFKIKSVLVDGENLGEIAEYVFENVQDNHEISVIFETNAAVEEWDFGFNIYPNPSNEQVTIEGENMKNISVYNVLGQMIESLDGLQSDKEKINTINFENGIYIFRITTQNGNIISKRVVIAH